MSGIVWSGLPRVAHIALFVRQWRLGRRPSGAIMEGNRESEFNN
jgi:hypothetical protein